MDQDVLKAFDTHCKPNLLVKLRAMLGYSEQLEEILMPLFAAAYEQGYERCNDEEVYGSRILDEGR